MIDKLYICSECKNPFRETKTIYEHGEYEVSPCCYAPFIEAPMCDFCEQSITDKYIVLPDGQYVCGYCYLEKDVFDPF